MLRTEHTSTALRMAAAGAGVGMAPAHMVRGAVGEDCVLLSLDPAWHRSPAVFAAAAGGPSAAEPDAHRAVLQQGCDLD
ncbi:hypothetical protein ACIRS3_07290 [Streptomyces virginiae]|uniref:hypothetical protein n=1 Tax=Streptomyces virginiae TaxID=1961 RepID=UPI0037FD7DC4